MHNQASTNDSERCSTSRLQRAQKSPRHASLHLSSLATNCCSHQIQGVDACLQIYHRLCTLLLPLTLTSLHSYQKPTLIKGAKACGTITERHEITLQDILVHCSLLVERSSCLYPECRIPGNIQKTAENSSLS